MARAVIFVNRNTGLRLACCFMYALLILIFLGTLDAEFGDQHSSLSRRRRTGVSIYISFIDLERDNMALVATCSLANFAAIYIILRQEGFKRFGAALCSLFIIQAFLMPSFLPYPALRKKTSQHNSPNLMDHKPNQSLQQPSLIVDWVKLPRKLSQEHRVIVAQTCGHGKYSLLLRETRKVNEQFAMSQGFDYMSVVGLYYGSTEWHSTFNKAFILKAILDETAYDILFYLDADAMVINPSFPLLASFPLAYNGRQAETFLLAAHGSSPRHPCNFNAGVLVWNLSHPLVHNVSSIWVDRSLRSMQNRGLDDQSLLWDILRQLLTHKEQWSILPELENHDRRKNIATKNIAHILRPTGPGDWSGDTVLARVKSARLLASSIKWTR